MKIIILLCLLLIGVPAASWADLGDPVDYDVPFAFYIDSYTEGYNTDPRYKYVNEPYAHVTVEYGTFGRATNYLIIASNDVQISHNAIVTYLSNPYYDYCQLLYYNKDHVGNVRMRANSGGTGINYIVGGWWMPNFRS